MVKVQYHVFDIIAARFQSCDTARSGLKTKREAALCRTGIGTQYRAYLICFKTCAWPGQASLLTSHKRSDAIERTASNRKVGESCATLRNSAWVKTANFNLLHAHYRQNPPPRLEQQAAFHFAA
jgi:hypothetical protein